MKILIIGKGGREHAIAWKAAQSPLADKIFVAPGSDAIAEFCSCVAIKESETEKLVNFAEKEQIDLTIVGPEVALMNGIADTFKAHNLPIFAPSKAAAMIEGSKEFAKKLMLKYHIPTAKYQSFINFDEAMEYAKKLGFPTVIKYDGLAAGKGVVVALSEEEAANALKEMLVDHKFGHDKVIIEEFLEGPEFSLMALVNGEIVLPLSIAQDHKRAFDGDKGPNTGGMGAYSPVPMISEENTQLAINSIMIPAAKGLVAEGKAFTGILYGGLILTKDGPKVIEFNARFGDPETEVVLPRMKSDLIEIIVNLLNNKPFPIEWYDKTILGVVLASEGYPNSYPKGLPIHGLDKIPNLVFHAGTQKNEQIWTNDGGRVLFIIGEGKTAQEAKNDAYNGVKMIDAPNLFYRKDIGKQAIDFVK